MLESGGFFIAGGLGEYDPRRNHHTGVLQHAAVAVGSHTLTLANVHGIAEWPKTDTPERLEQSKKIEEFLQSAPGPQVLCGDFNLSPTTESIALFARAGLRNMIQKFNISTTRSDIERELFKDQVGRDLISDYIFVSDAIEPAALSVPEVEDSDHLPLLFTFSIAK